MPCACGGKGSWEESRVVCFLKLSSSPDSLPDVVHVTPFLTALCSEVLDQYLGWCLGLIVPCWLEDLDAGWREDLSQRL